MDDYLSKPVSLEAVQHLLVRYYPHTTSLAIPSTSSGLTPEAFTKIGRTYLEDTTRLLEEMQEALVRGDRNQMTHLAHKLKSSSAIVDALPLSQLCQQLETEAPAATHEQLQATVVAITAAYQQVSATLNARLFAQSEP
jgi:HPt (histidine-containing phosphotransfer) domain-containing protein